MRDPNPLQSLRTALGLIAGSNLLTDPKSLPGMFGDYECFYSGQPDHLAIVDEIKTMWKAGSLPEVPVSYRRVLLNEPKPVDEVLSSPSRRRRKVTLARALKEASKIGRHVSAAVIEDGKVTLTFGEPGAAPPTSSNPWDAEIERLQ